MVPATLRIIECILDKDQTQRPKLLIMITIQSGKQLMKFVAVIVAFIALLATSDAVERPSFHTKGSPTGKPSGPLKPGEYWWNPQRSPDGPVMVLVSLPQQMMHVYRNGILIGRSTVSSG